MKKLLDKQFNVLLYIVIMLISLAVFLLTYPMIDKKEPIPSVFEELSLEEFKRVFLFQKKLAEMDIPHLAVFKGKELEIWYFIANANSNNLDRIEHMKHYFGLNDRIGFHVVIKDVSEIFGETL